MDRAKAITITRLGEHTQKLDQGLLGTHGQMQRPEWREPRHIYGRMFAVAASEVQRPDRGKVREHAEGKVRFDLERRVIYRQHEVRGRCYEARERVLGGWEAGDARFLDVSAQMGMKDE